MKFKKVVSYILLFVFFITNSFPIIALDSDVMGDVEGLERSVSENSKEEKAPVDILSAKAYILTNYETGQVLYEKNADEHLKIASITKIMTSLLVVEAIKDGKISLNDMVVASKNAKPAQNESSIWLADGEKMSVRDLLKSVLVHSANDAARTLAECIGGSEESFVEMMNKKAKDLGMKNTKFTNASGLDDDENYCSARDVSIMARELLKCNWITNYTKIEKDKLRDGKTDLTNRNKLIITYKGCNGLKTGTDEIAKNCLCATAVRNKIPLCAVALGCDTSDDRWKSCTNLLDYGFNSFRPIEANKKEIEEEKVSVKTGKKQFVSCRLKDENKTYLVKKTEYDQVEKEIKLDDSVEAPVEEGEVIGKINYYINKEGKNKNKKDKRIIATQGIVADEEVERLTYLYVNKQLWKNFLWGENFFKL